MGTEYFLSTFLGEMWISFFFEETVVVLSSDGKNQRSPGDGFVSTFAQRVLTGAFPPVPLFLRGHPTVSLACSSGGQSVVGLFLLTSGPLGPGYAKSGGKVR